VTEVSRVTTSQSVVLWRLS